MRVGIHYNFSLNENPVLARQKPSAVPLEPIIFEFSDYANHVFNVLNPASFRFDGCSYKPSKKLGSGVYGEAWLCTSSDPLLSLVLKREIANDKGIYTEGEAFAHEAEVNRKIYGLGEISGAPKDKKHAHYLLMRFIEGVTLSTLFKSFAIFHTPSDREMLRLWVLFVAAIIDFHRHGLLHCDLHVGNAIASYIRDVVSLIDFGFTVPIGVLRDDCDVATKKKLKHPFRPPETFNDIKNPVVYAQKNQDAWAAGYYLSNIKKLATSLAPAQRSKVNEITAELMQVTPAMRMPLDKAICEIISSCFQESIRSVRVSITPEWIVIVGAIIQMRMRELFIEIAQPIVSSNAITQLSTRKQAQYAVLEKLSDVLKSIAHEPAAHALKLNHQKFLMEMNATTDETLKLVRNVMISFFAPVASVQHESGVLPRQRRASLPVTTVVRPERAVRANTPPAGVVKTRLFLPTIEKKVNQERPITMPIFRKKIKRAYPQPAVHVPPMKFAAWR